MQTLLIMVHVIAAIGVIGLIMLQQGKGAEAGASFGAGASQTVFGSQGSANFLSRTTAILATVFFCTSVALAMAALQQADGLGDIGLPMQQPVIEMTTDAPVTSAPTESTTDAPVAQ